MAFSKSNDLELALALESLENHRRTVQALERKVRADFIEDLFPNGRFNLEKTARRIHQETIAFYSERSQDYASMRLDEVPAYEEKLHTTINATADSYARSGGDTTSPRYFTVSFPGKDRGVLFDALNRLEFKLGNNAEGEVHVMDDNSVGKLGGAVQFPVIWTRAFKGHPAWKHMTKILKKRGFSANEGPRWFVEHWGLAAWNSAQSNAATGAGVILFATWVGYDKSDWCKIECLFGICLASRFPQSVYAWRHFGGFYLTGREKLKHVLRY